MKKSRSATLLATTLLFVFATGAIAALPGPLQVQIESPSIAVGGSTLITLTGGSPPYKVSNSRSDVAPLSCNKPATSCWATGKAAGVTTIVIQDGRGITSQADLTVTKSAKPVAEQIKADSLQKQDVKQNTQTLSK